MRPVLLLAFALSLVGCDSSSAPSGPLADVSDVAYGWKWSSPPGMKCRDGSATGYAWRPSNTAGTPPIDTPDDNLLIVLEGGGYCLDKRSCNLNDSTYNRASFHDFLVGTANTQGRHDKGVFDDRPENPFDPDHWTVAFVPYCTGDLHMGQATTSKPVPGLSTEQLFTGRNNFSIVLQYLGQLMPDPERVVVAGVSAGGFGATRLHPVAADSFASANVNLLVDAGPFLTDPDVFDPGFQQGFVSLWDVDCSDCNGEPLGRVVRQYAVDHPGSLFGIAASGDEYPVRKFYCPPGEQCDDKDDPSRISVSTWRSGLLSLRTYLDTPNTGTFYMDGSFHGSLFTNGLYAANRQADGLTLTEWIERISSGSTPNGVLGDYGFMTLP